jgi:hypothetical protein
MDSDDRLTTSLNFEYCHEVFGLKNADADNEKEGTYCR